MKNKMELLTAPMVARICERDLKTIHNWVNKGKIDAFRTPGRHMRFTKDSVISFLRKQGFDIPEELIEVEA
jgi:excisionase family DNA binding protein